MLSCCEFHGVGCAQGKLCPARNPLDEPLTTGEALIFYAIVLLCIAALAVIAGASLPYLP